MHTLEKTVKVWLPTFDGAGRPGKKTEHSGKLLSFDTERAQVLIGKVTHVVPVADVLDFDAAAEIERLLAAEEKEKAEATPPHPAEGKTLDALLPVFNPESGVAVLEEGKIVKKAVSVKVLSVVGEQATAVDAHGVTHVIPVSDLVMGDTNPAGGGGELPLEALTVAELQGKVKALNLIPAGSKGDLIYAIQHGEERLTVLKLDELREKATGLKIAWKEDDKRADLIAAIRKARIMAMEPEARTKLAQSLEIDPSQPLEKLVEEICAGVELTEGDGQ